MTVDRRSPRSLRCFNVWMSKLLGSAHIEALEPARGAGTAGNQAACTSAMRLCGLEKTHFRV